MDGQGIKNMDARKNISRCIRFIQPSDYICKNVVPGEFNRAEMLCIGISIGYNKENCHPHHQVKYQLIIFMSVFVEKDKIYHCQDHIRKPQQIRYNKKFTERNQIIKNSMYNMVTVNGPGFQIMKNQNIQNTVNPDYQAVTVFG